VGFAAFIDAGSAFKRTSAQRAHAARFAMTTIESIGKALAAEQPSAAMIRVWANDTATMLADHLTFD
jgi:hypothetical protein